MKTKITILLIVLLGIAIKTKAQEEPKTYHERMKLLLNELDSTKFKNNILYNKVYPLSRLFEFNQDGRKDTSNYKHFKQAIHELNLASNQQDFISAERIEQKAISSQFQDQVLVGIISMEMTILRDDIFDENDLKIEIDSSGSNKKYLEIPNKDPYKHIQSLVISPLQERIEQITGGSVTFNFQKAFIQKTNNPIKSLYVDFGDGQLQPIIENRSFSNTTVSYSFATDGNKMLKFSGMFQDGTPFETYAKAAIELVPIITDIVKIRATETFTPYEPDYLPNTFTPGNLFAEVEYKAYYSTNPPRTSIEKPIIITDGIDYEYPGRDILEIYNETLEIDGTSGNKLGDQLRALGYDVIIVDYPTYKIGTYDYDVVIEWDEYGNPESWITVTDDFPRQGGADYIERNAKAIKKLIRHINDKLTVNNSSEELVIVGPSMGGLVTRWALKEIEDAGEDHNTRLWVSFDAPHQGANIPPGIQLMASYFNEESSLDKLTRSAPKQMLLRHYLNETNQTIYGGAPNYRTQFKNELDAIEYPQNLRKVALVNGTTIGEMNNSSGDKIAEVHIEMEAWPHWDVLNGDIYCSGAAPGSHAVLDFIAGNVGPFEDATKYNYSSIGSIDNAPGCYIPLTGNYSLNQSINQDGGVGYVAQTINKFTFMTTKSTLDFQGDPFLSLPFCDRDLVASGETPFDSYYAPTYNQEHVELNVTNVDWIINEINGTPELPFVYCLDDFEIEGPNQLCGLDQAYYTTNYGSVGVMWTSDNGFVIVDEDSAGIWIERDPDYTIDYNGTISAYLQYTTAMKTIGCMPLAPLFTIDYDDTANIEILLQDILGETPLEQQGITDVDWTLTSGDSTLMSADEELAVISGSNFTGTVTLTNSTGSTTQTFFWPDPNTCYAITKISGDTYQVIDRCDDNAVVDTLPIKELYDMYGNMISDIPLNNQDLDLNNIGNSGCIYVIHVDVNGENISKTIVKD